MRRGRSWMPLSKLGLLILIFLVALLSLISFHVATKLREDKNLPKTYAEPLPLQNAAPDQTTNYVIALGNSVGMEDMVKVRNAAARALIYSLPYEENIQAAMFFFPSETRAPLELLPMDQLAERQKLLDLLDDKMAAQGETDLAEMLETALGKFGDGPNERRVIFAVTDGSSDGALEEIAKKNERFFALCGEAQGKADIYLVYISKDEVPEKLENGLHTKTVTLEEDSEDVVSRLMVWEEGELAKILSIPDVDDLEAALMNLRFSGAGAVFNRRVEKDSTVSFPVFPLCAQEITISISGGSSARDAILSVKTGEGKDLLSQNGVEFTGSRVTLRSQKGLPAGLYTMEVSAKQPFSMVIACKYDYQFRYGFSKSEYMEDPPASQDAVLYMMLVDPDGNELRTSDSVALSMNVYGLDASGKYGLLRKIQNKGTIPGDLLRDGTSLELRPVVAYGGVKIEGEQGWTIRPADLPPTLKDMNFFKLMFLSGAKEISLGKIKNLVADRETPAEDILVFNAGEDGLLLKQEGDTISLVDENSGSWPFWKTYHLSVTAVDESQRTAMADWSVTAVAILPTLLIMLLMVIACLGLRWTHRKGKAKRAADQQKAVEAQNARENQELLYRAELKVDRTFIRAGLCWVLQNEQGETTHIGGLGLTDEKGQLQGGCDLSKTQVYCLDKTGQLKDGKNPLDFGRWRYSSVRKCTELLLWASPNVSDCGVEELKRVIKSPPGVEGDVICFGVNQKLPYREVQMKTAQGTFTFRLEYYTDDPPFYL